MSIMDNSAASANCPAAYIMPRLALLLCLIYCMIDLVFVFRMALLVTARNYPETTVNLFCSAHETKGGISSGVPILSFMSEMLSAAAEFEPIAGLGGSTLTGF
jgi:hypothetical protein